VIDPLAPWDFDLPDERVAREAVEPRDAARLLCVGTTCADRRVWDLPSLLRAGDLLVVNDVRVRRARLVASRATGGEIEVLLLADDRALCRPSRRLREGEVLQVGPGASVRLLAREADGTWRVACAPDADALAQAHGAVPLPPYFGRAATEDDSRRYQTVFARPGPLAAAAAPTAGLHLTEGLLGRLSEVGVGLARVTLEVGLGTFKPLTEEQLARGELHEERYELPESTWDAVAETRARGGRVVAVGTTTVRVLEAAEGPGSGRTRIFLRAGARFRRVDLMMTNFHLPRSSLMMLVTAFGGHGRVMAAYAHAIAQGYRFYSYGDACLVEREHATG
jgi:S-adenosylmethionine:tRNA ribosyltransferase-isomerase